VRRGISQIFVVDFLSALVLLLFALVKLADFDSQHRPPTLDTYGVYAVTVAWAPASNDDVDTYVQDPQGEITDFTNYDRTTAEAAAERILFAHPRLSGFFAVNDEMALGVADAVGSAGKSGAVKIIGVDGIPEALDAVRLGSISATVSQYPYVWGRWQSKHASRRSAAPGRPRKSTHRSRS